MRTSITLSLSLLALLALPSSSLAAPAPVPLPTVSELGANSSTSSSSPAVPLRRPFAQLTMIGQRRPQHARNQSSGINTNTNTNSNGNSKPRLAFMFEAMQQQMQKAGFISPSSPPREVAVPEPAKVAKTGPRKDRASRAKAAQVLRSITQQQLQPPNPQESGVQNNDRQWSDQETIRQLEVAKQHEHDHLQVLRIALDHDSPLVIAQNQRVALLGDAAKTARIMAGLDAAEMNKEASNVDSAAHRPAARVIREESKRERISSPSPQPVQAEDTRIDQGVVDKTLVAAISQETEIQTKAIALVLEKEKARTITVEPSATPQPITAVEKAITSGPPDAPSFDEAAFVSTSTSNQLVPNSHEIQPTAQRLIQPNAATTGRQSVSLLEQIQQGKQLKKIHGTEAPKVTTKVAAPKNGSQMKANPPPVSDSSAPRSAVSIVHVAIAAAADVSIPKEEPSPKAVNTNKPLSFLDQVRAGKQLKKVQVNTTQDSVLGDEQSRLRASLSPQRIKNSAAKDGPDGDEEEDEASQIDPRSGADQERDANAQSGMLAAIANRLDVQSKRGSILVSPTSEKGKPAASSTQVEAARENTSKGEAVAAGTITGARRSSMFVPSSAKGTGDRRKSMFSPASLASPKKVTFAEETESEFEGSTAASGSLLGMLGEETRKHIRTKSSGAALILAQAMIAKEDVDSWDDEPGSKPTVMAEPDKELQPSKAGSLTGGSNRTPPLASSAIVAKVSAYPVRAKFVMPSVASPVAAKLIASPIRSAAPTAPTGFKLVVSAKIASLPTPSAGARFVAPSKFVPPFSLPPAAKLVASARIVAGPSSTGVKLVVAAKVAPLTEVKSIIPLPRAATSPSSSGPSLAMTTIVAATSPSATGIKLALASIRTAQTPSVASIKLPAPSMRPSAIILPAAAKITATPVRAALLASSTVAKPAMVSLRAASAPIAAKLNSTSTRAAMIPAPTAAKLTAPSVRFTVMTPVGGAKLAPLPSHVPLLAPSTGLKSAAASSSKLTAAVTSVGVTTSNPPSKPVSKISALINRFQS